MINVDNLIEVLNELETGYNGYGPDGYGFYFPTPYFEKGPYVRLDDVLETIAEWSRDHDHPAWNLAKEERDELNRYRFLHPGANTP